MKFWLGVFTGLLAFVISVASFIGGMIFGYSVTKDSRKDIRPKYNTIYGNYDGYDDLLKKYKEKANVHN